MDSAFLGFSASGCFIWEFLLFLPAPGGKSTRENVLGLSERQAVFLQVIISNGSCLVVPLMETIFLGKKRMETIFWGKKRCKLHLEMTALNMWGMNIPGHLRMNISEHLGNNISKHLRDAGKWMSRARGLVGSPHISPSTTQNGSKVHLKLLDFI